MGGPRQSTKYACPDGITRSCRIAIDNDRLGDRDCPGQKLKGGFVADCHMPQSGQKLQKTNVVIMYPNIYNEKKIH